MREWSDPEGVDKKVRRNEVEQSREGTEKDEEEGPFWKKGPTEYYI